MESLIGKFFSEIFSMKTYPIGQHLNVMLQLRDVFAESFVVIHILFWRKEEIEFREVARDKVIRFNLNRR